ncbi:hypothetical protein [Nonomuraea insulae]|uniref:Indole-3-glycerol phosphate synthase n=1 Tax=Nonomuraea insulae TaxID=1616787 RepID=A0ABW1CQI6_9ACTN
MFTTILMIEQQLTATDVDFVTTLHDDSVVSFVVLMRPQGSEDRLLRSIDDVAPGGPAPEDGDFEEEGRAAALALEHSVGGLRAAGSEAVGQLMHGHPLDLLRSVVDETHADEVIVLAAPHLVEKFFERDWASQARHKVGVPVLKVYAHNDEDEPVVA